MKPLHHYLRRFCSEQVQILLERMDNHFSEEFALSDSKWDVYTSRSGRAYDYYTKIEAYCVSKTCKEQYAIYKRQQMLNGILERTLSRAVSSWEYEREQRGAMQEEAMAAKPSKVLTTAELAQQARSILGQQFQTAYQQNETPKQSLAQHITHHKQLLNDQLRNWLTQ